MDFPRFFAGAVSLAACFVSTATAASNYTGLVLPFREVVVSSPVQSTIDSIERKEGDTVARGDTLAQLDNRIEKLDMLRTKAAMEKRQFDFEGTKNLFEDNIISEDEAMKGRIELELARLQAEQAEEINRLRTITAPISGIIVEKMREIGESVTATQPMFRLVDIDKVFVQFYLPVEDSASIKVGRELQIKCRAADEETMFPGRVEFVDPRVDAASGLIRVKVIVDNPDHAIKPGLRAEIFIPESN